MAEPAPASSDPATAPDADTDRIPTPPPSADDSSEQRRRTLRSRKFWCAVILTVIPPLNHLTIGMPLDHVLATMFPWAAWGGGEWGLDVLSGIKKLLAGGR